MTPTQILECEDLYKTFGKPAVNGLSLRIASGEFYALLGPNGAGKTTTLRMIAGLLEPDRGSVRLGPFDMSEAPEHAKRRLAYLPDEPAIYAKLTPLEYLEFVGCLWGMDLTHAERRAHELLDLLGLTAHARQRCEEFSRGMKQKLVLAGALLHEPDLLMLDEPLTGLDPHAARLVKDLLLLHVKRGGAVLLTTHIIEIAERLAHRIGIITNGRIIAEGEIGELRARTRCERGTLEDVFLELTQDA